MRTSGVPRSLAVVLLTLFVAGCAGTTTPPSAAPEPFPLTLSTVNGAVTIPHRPARIVSLSPTATDDLFAVGAGPQVVAVDADSAYPTAAPHTSLSGFTPNVEAIAAFSPDLVVASEDANNMVAQLSALKIPVLIETAAANLDGAYRQMIEIGAATGNSSQAATTVAGLKQKVQSLLKSIPVSTKTLSVYHELDQTFYSATSNTFIGQVYRLLGLKNIADGSPGSTPYPQLSAEYIISANPDVIVLADTVCCAQNATAVAARPGWSSITAVKSGAVIPVDDSIASQWGTRIVLFIQALVNELKALHQSAA